MKEESREDDEEEGEKICLKISLQSKRSERLSACVCKCASVIVMGRGGGTLYFFFQQIFMNLIIKLVLTSFSVIIRSLVNVAKVKRIIYKCIGKCAVDIFEVGAQIYIYIYKQTQIERANERANELVNPSMLKR